MNKLHDFIRQEKGYTLLEFMLSLPVLVGLLFSLTIASLYFLKLYTYTVSQAELQDQVRISMERIVRDMSYTDQIQLIGNDVTLWVWTGSERQQITYSYKDSKLYRNTQPLTGDCRLGTILIIRFRCQKLSSRYFRIEITGRNYTIHRDFTLLTTVYLTDRECVLWQEE